MSAHRNDGGPAFPVPLNPGQSWQGMAPCDGMTLRDYFATHATEEDLRAWIPSTVGQVAELMHRLGWIKPRNIGALAYSDQQFNELRCWARYRHADAMLQAREGGAA